MTKAIESALRAAVVMASLGLALTPFWLWLGLAGWVAPEGFWGKLAVGAGGLFFLGATQIGPAGDYSSRVVLW